MTDCLNASFYVSIKMISSKESLGTINLPAVCREPRQRLLPRAGRCGQRPESGLWIWQEGGGQEARRKNQQVSDTG